MTDAEYAQLVCPTRRCTKCRKTKDAGEFDECVQRGKRVRRSWCKACLRKYWQEYSRRRKWRREVGNG